jgi:hypothetical protein
MQIDRLAEKYKQLPQTRKDFGAAAKGRSTGTCSCTALFQGGSMPSWLFVNVSHGIPSAGMVD